MSFLIAALIGVGLVVLPLANAQLAPGGRRRPVSVRHGLGVPAGIGLLAAAATSSLAHRRNEHSLWWGLVSFGVVAWVVAEYQRWSIRMHREKSQDASRSEQWPQVAARWLYRIVMVFTVLGWLLLGDWCCFQYSD